MITVRLALVIVCPGCGGTGAVANVALHQARELARGNEVLLLSESLPERRIDGVEFGLLRPARFGWMRRFAHVPNEVAFALAARHEIIRRHRERKVDMVICHGHPVARIACVPLRRKHVIPYALVTHGDIFDRPAGTYDSRLTWFYRQVTPGAYRKADLVIALSPHMRELALCSGASPERIAIIPNGIDPGDIGLTECDKKRYKNNESDPLEILFVGRLSVEKGVDVLLHACAILVARTTHFRLKIAGGGAEASNLKNMTKRLGLGNQVVFLGPVPRNKLGELYLSTDAVCVPSRSDPLPTVVLEAMASGVAVIGADTGGINYMVEHKKTGLLFPPDDARALAERFAWLAGNRHRATEMGIEGQQRARECFNWTTVGKKIHIAAQAMASTFD